MVLLTFTVSKLTSELAENNDKLIKVLSIYNRIQTDLLAARTEGGRGGGGDNPGGFTRNNNVKFNNYFLTHGPRSSYSSHSSIRCTCTGEGHRVGATKADKKRGCTVKWLRPRS